MGSLRVRLFAFAAIVIAAALLVTGVSLSALFSRSVERRIGQELDTHLNQIIGNIRITQAGLSITRKPVDPRFQSVFGGLYWQIHDITTATILRSRSLWDTYLEIPEDAILPGQTHTYDITGPQDSTLVAHEIMVVLNAPDGNHQIQVIAAIDRADLNELASGFSWDLAPVLAILGAVLLIGFTLQIGAGLKPAHRVLAGVNAIRAGERKRLSADGVPEEIAPLVDEVNALLDAQDQAISRARDRAANLAHGLKTPLTALESDVERLQAKGETDLASDIDELLKRMRRHIERELARARIRHGRSNERVLLAPPVEAIIRTLKRTPQGERLDLKCEIDPAIAVPVDIDDLNELIGNLAENAVRFAVTQVRIDAEATADAVIIRVSDDGPGLDPAQMEQASTAGQRFDETGLGAGLGLAIAGDIADSFAGRIDLGHSELGGLEARVLIPLKK